MPKGVQRNNKESKKPKKDSGSSTSAGLRPLGEGAPSPSVVTAVIPRGKKKDGVK